jgi:hypothetical protein
VHAKNEEPGKEQIAQDRVSEKHPARSGAVLRKADGERLDQAREIFHVTGIAQPRERVRDHIKENRAGERSGEQRFPRGAIGEGQPEAADDGERQVAAGDERREHRRAVVNVQDDIGNEEGDQRHGEFEFRR